jgi:hypothetical protein
MVMLLLFIRQAGIGIAIVVKPDLRAMVEYVLAMLPLLRRWRS